MALLVGILRVYEIDGLLAVDFDDDVIADGGHLLREPVVRLVQLLEHQDFVLFFLRKIWVERGVQAAGLDGITVSGIYLGLVALRERRTVDGAKILAAVALVVDLCLDTITEVRVVAALAEQVAGLAAADQDAFLDLPLRLIFRVRLPA